MAPSNHQAATSEGQELLLEPELQRPVHLRHQFELHAWSWTWLIITVSSRSSASDEQPFHEAATSSNSRCNSFNTLGLALFPSELQHRCTDCPESYREATFRRRSMGYHHRPPPNSISAQDRAMRTTTVELSCHQPDAVAQFFQQKRDARHPELL